MKQLIKPLNRSSLILISIFLMFSGCMSRDIAENSLPDKARFITQEDQYLIASAVASDSPFGADLTGEKEASEAIQMAIDYVETLGGGVVYLPAGRYRLESPVKLGRNVVLWGEWSPPEEAHESPQTILLAYHGENDPDGEPLIHCPSHHETGLRNLSVYYPKQSIDNVVPYSSAIRAGGAELRNITLYNAYRGIDMKMLNGSLVSDIYMTPLKEGFHCPESWEFSWMYHIYFTSEIWAMAPGDMENIPGNNQMQILEEYMKENLLGLRFGKIDAVSLYDVKVPFAQTGILVRKPENTPLMGREHGLGGVLSHIEADITENGWDSYFYGMHYAHMDKVPEAHGKSYSFAPMRRAATSLVLSVKGAPYHAVGDGVTDDTKAIEWALMDAGRNGGGTVYVPQGHYRITKPLVIPRGTELRGPLGLGQIRQGSETTSLEIDFCSDTKDPYAARAAFTLKDHAGIRGLTILYPHQGYAVKDLVPYPYTIRGDGEGCYVMDSHLLNSWLGIDFETQKCDDFLLAGIWGTTFELGTAIGGGSKDGRIERVAWSYGPWKEAARNAHRAFIDHKGPLGDYSFANTTFFRIGESENLKTYGIVGFYPRNHLLLDGDKGLIKDAEFFHTMFDVASYTNILAKGEVDASFYGYFGTGGRDWEHNFIETGDTYSGDISVYSYTLLDTNINKPLEQQEGTINLYQDSSLTYNLPFDQLETTGNREELEKVFDRDWETNLTINKGDEIIVDLGETVPLIRWRIDFSGKTEKSRMNVKGLDLLISEDGERFIYADRIYDNIFPWIDRPFDEGTKARYLKFVFTIPGGNGKTAYIDQIDIW